MLYHPSLWRFPFFALRISLINHASTYGLMPYVFARWRNKLQTITSEACASETRFSPHAQLWRWPVATLSDLWNSLIESSRKAKEGAQRRREDAHRFRLWTLARCFEHTEVPKQLYPYRRKVDEPVPAAISCRRSYQNDSRSDP
jgi:hypothetical protein